MPTKHSHVEDQIDAIQCLMRIVVHLLEKLSAYDDTEAKLMMSTDAYTNMKNLLDDIDHEAIH